MSDQPTYGSVTLNAWRSATRHICAVMGCDAPCTDEPFGWHVTHGESGARLEKPLDIEAFFCEHHETEIGRSMGYRGN